MSTTWPYSCARFLNNLGMASSSEVITIVSGLPRSGTSMMMKMLEAGGLEPMTDNIRKADVDNPKGYYEYEIVKKIAEDTSWLPDTRGKAFKMVAPLLLHLPKGFSYQIVFMRRDMTEMLQSQNKMLERLGTGDAAIPDEKIAGLFQQQLDRIMPWLEARTDMRVLYVNYNDVMVHTTEEAQRIAAFLEQDMNATGMQGIVDHDLYRNKA